MDQEESVTVDLQNSQPPTAMEEEPPASTSLEEEDDDEVLIVKEGKKEVVLMEIDVDDEDGLSEAKPDENNDNEKNKLVENGPDFTKESKSTESSNIIVSEKPVPNYSILGRSVSSPIIVNDDSSSNILPGISEESASGVFGFALNSGILRERSESPEPVEEKRIVYKSMEFDFPRIKIEPLDPVSDDVAEGDLVGQETSEVQMDQPIEPPETVIIDEPIDLTADDDDSMDFCDGSKPPLHQMTSIDGNLHQEGTYLLILHFL